MLGRAMGEMVGKGEMVGEGFGILSRKVLTFRETYE